MKQCIKMLVAAALTLVMALGTACGAAPASTSALAPSDAVSTALESKTETPNADLLVSVWGGPHADLQKSVVAKYPNGTVTIDDVDYGNLQSKQVTSFAAQPGTGNYDIVWIDSNWLQQYVQAGYIQPIDEFAAKSGLDMGIYAGGLLEDCKVDGKLYGLPTFAQCLILCYDAEALKAAKLEVPKNIDELIAVAKYFKEQGTGIAMPAKQGTASINLFSQLLYSDGGNYFAEDGILAITSEACVKAAGYYDALAKYSVEGSTAWHHDEVAEAVRTKKAPIGIVMSALCNQNYDPEKSMIADTVAYAPLTGASGKGAAVNTFWIWAVAANSANPEAAYNFCVGHTVLGKTVTVNYKGKKRRKAEDEELMIFKNTHEAIIDEETWELAHRLRKTIRKPSYPDRPANPLTGLVYCADCGHKLTHRQPSPNKEKVFDADNAYVCGNYRQLTHDCSMHFIKTSVLQDLILSAIREVSTFVRSDEKEFLHLVREETNAGIEIAAKEQKKQLHKAEKRIAELDGLIKKLYEGNATGKIPDKHFNRMLTEYDKEQSSLEQEFSALQQAISTQKQDYENPQRFIALVKRHTDFTELTTPMLNEFIEKVIVHEATGNRAHRKQKVDIYFNFIGNFVPPKQEPDAPTLKGCDAALPYQRVCISAVNFCICSAVSTGQPSRVPFRCRPSPMIATTFQ